MCVYKITKVSRVDEHDKQGGIWRQSLAPSANHQDLPTLDPEYQAYHKNLEHE